MSAITQLLCNKFGGIRHRNSVFNDELVTASDIQNVELYYTSLNGGVGIRTMYGNISINDDLLGKERIINIFQSIQKGTTLFLVYTETIEEREEDVVGRFYLYDKLSNTLTLKKDNILKSGVCNGFDIAQGWSDLFFFTNGKQMFTFEWGKTNGNNELDEIVDMNNIYGRYKDENDNYVKVLGLGATLFNNRLWIFSKNVLWYSVTSDIYDFSTASSDWTTSAGYILTTKDITAIHEYLGSMAVFYKDSSQLLTVSNGDFALGEDSPGGCASFNSLVFHGTDLYFYDDTKKGVFAFQQIVNGDKTLSDNFAVDIQEELVGINDNNLDKIHTESIILSERNEIWWIIPTNSTYTVYETVDDTTVEVTKEASIILIYDYLKKEWIKRKSQKINAVKVIDNELYSAGDDGNILSEYSSYLFNGDYIEHYFNCSPLNLGANNTLKVLVFQPRVTFNLPYTNKFKVKYVKNYDNSKKPKIKLMKTKYKNVSRFGESRFNLSYFVSRNTTNVGKLPNANFKILEISLYTDAQDQNFAIRNLEFSKIKVKQV